MTGLFLPYYVVNRDFVQIQPLSGLSREICCNYSNLINFYVYGNSSESKAHYAAKAIDRPLAHEPERPCVARAGGDA